MSNKENNEELLEDNKNILSDVLAPKGLYLGIELRPDGYTVVSIEKEGDIVLKKDLYAPRKQKALAMENFKIAASQFIVKFNQSQFKKEG